MRRQPYKRQKTNTGDLRTPITFYEYVQNEGPEPGEKEKSILFNTLAKVDAVWLKDLELAKSTGTLSDITITMRDTKGGYTPSNKHYFSIDSPEYEGIKYNIRHVQPNLQNRMFVNVVGSLSL